jgi:exocyst complex component 4
MYKILELSVPGLVLQREQSKVDASTTKAGRGLDSVATGHKILIPPNAFNVVHLLPSTIAFLDRVKELIPYMMSIIFANCRHSLVSSTVTSFLDDFLVAVFLPQLEDTVSERFNKITEDDEFQTAIGPEFEVQVLGPSRSKDVL